MIARLARLLRANGGTAAMEFALVGPVLLLILGGIFEYGRVLMVEHGVRDAVNLVARQAVVQGLTGSEAETLLDDRLAVIRGIEDYSISSTDGTELLITVSGSFNLVMGGLLPDDMISFEVTTSMQR